MPTVTTEGLQAEAAAAATVQDAQWAIAAGTADVITAVYPDPVTVLTDGLILGFRASAANATATPTFGPDGLTQHTITKVGGVALVPGDIPAVNAEMMVRYNLANTRWELLNPAAAAAKWGVAGGTVDAITLTLSPALLTVPDGTLISFRALGANATTTPNLAVSGLTARTITKQGGAALVAGDIPAVNAEMMVRYNLANTRWELLNPASAKSLFKAIPADDTGGQNVNTAQPWFPTAGAVSLPANTSYLFEGTLVLSRAAGSTSHTTGVLFGGTATLTPIEYIGECKTGDANDLQTISGFFSSVATLFTLKAASTSTTEQIVLKVRGVVRINAAGTLIPQFQYSAAPGGAPTVKRGTYFRLTPMGLDTVTSSGPWA